MVKMRSVVLAHMFICFYSLIHVHVHDPEGKDKQENISIGILKKKKKSRGYPTLNEFGC